MSFTTKDLWDKLSDIPIDENECIEEQFIHFEIGTFREEIWHWFEDELGAQIQDLYMTKEIWQLRNELEKKKDAANIDEQCLV